MLETAESDNPLFFQELFYIQWIRSYHGLALVLKSESEQMHWVLTSLWSSPTSPLLFQIRLRAHKTSQWQFCFNLLAFLGTATIALLSAFSASSRQLVAHYRCSSWKQFYHIQPPVTVHFSLEMKLKHIPSRSTSWQPHIESATAPKCLQ